MNQNIGSDVRTAVAKPDSFPWLDWLRIGLASVVVIDHADFRFAPFLIGALAVQVFFAISWWLTGGILLRSKAADLPKSFVNWATRSWTSYALALALLYGFAAGTDGVDFFWLNI